MLEPGAARPFDPLELLAEASGCLAASFDTVASLPSVAKLCTARFADYCAIAVLDDGAYRIVAYPEEVAPPAVDLSGLISTAWLRSVGYESSIVLPLAGRGESHGCFVVACKSPDAFSSATERLTAILCIQISTAIDQALLFDRTQRVADRLQRALLPEALPAIAGATLHGAYRPASDEAEVGGDWYDAFALADGRIAFSLGDVAGHGLEAATIMGEIRQAMRSVALGDVRPSQVLEQVNGVINLRASIGMVTAVFGYYHPASRLLEYAVAGHPAPIVAVGNNRAAFLPGGGIPLGVTDSVGTRDWELTLAPGSQVIFYTDGLTEYGRDILDGERVLLKAGADMQREAPLEPAQYLLETIFKTTPNRDDAATLVLTSDNGPVPDRLVYSATPVAAPLARAALEQVARELHVDEERRFAFLVSVGEAIANAIEHGYRGESGAGPVIVNIRRSPTALDVEIEDHGRWRPFQRREERGRGISLMHELMDGVRISSSQNRTVVALTLKIAG